MGKTSISSPQASTMTKTPGTPRGKGGDLTAGNERIAFPKRPGSSVIDSPAEPLKRGRSAREY